ncbi:hypothetical protein CASFOL_029562 [Castilleja foliolosa]|uniref:KIB1-4 beta-propeller domain-containing protein n=1 Tax=Castilleja foliolosa TaxID=1961234 RepID=A0ABD3C901_9LAMI
MASLIIPQQKTHQSSSLIFSLSDINSFKNLNNDIDHLDYNFDDQEIECIGSSHGWLAFSQVKPKNNLYIRNPFSETRFNLPPKHTLPQIINHQLQYTKINKLVLCGNPSNGPNYTVIAMHNMWFRTTIAFCRPGDVKWADLGSNLETCYDAVCCDTTKTAYVLGPGPIVEGWDMKGPGPIRNMVIDVGCPTKLACAREMFPSDLYSTQWYLALSESGQLFLAMRYIGEFVRPYDGKVVYEGDTLTDYASEPLVCPYKTVGFYVFKFDGDGKKWVDVESLGDDCAMFVGGNESMIVSIKDKGVKGNAVYFTDDYWDRMNEDYSYGGHDNGVFYLGGTIETLWEDQSRILPPPFWITTPSN